MTSSRALTRGKKIILSSLKPERFTQNMSVMLFWLSWAFVYLDRFISLWKCHLIFPTDEGIFHRLSKYLSFILDACIILDFSKVISPAEAIVYSFSWITADSHLL